METKTKRQIQEEKWEKQDRASFRRWMKRKMQIEKREKELKGTKWEWLIKESRK